jgi:hypothetical protein
MLKKLIYFTLGNNQDYINLAILCIDSIMKTSYDGDILFITDKKNQVNEKIKYRKEILFHDVESSDLMRSSGNKLKIYNYKHIESYDKIIFCDIDTLWLKSPDILFEKIIDDKIYMSCEQSLMTDEFWNAGLFNSDEIKIIEENKIFGLNAGFMGFKSSMIPIIKKMDQFFESNLDYSSVCLEQPFINTFLFRNSLYDNSFTDLISHLGILLSSFDGVLLHFAGGPGSYEFKLDKMSKYKI